MRHRHPDSPATEHLVIVGNGMAGHRLVETLLKRDDRPARITVIGEERVAAYNRILLSPLLAGDMTRDALTLREADWYTEQGVELILGERVATLDCEARRLTTDAGRTLGYDRLVLATGSRPAMPPLPGLELDGVRAFRDLDDAAALTRTAEAGGNAVVIGGGLLGLEAAEGLRKRGMAVSLIQRDDRLMNRQLDATAATLLEAELTRRGLTIFTEANIAALLDDGQGRVHEVRLEDGTRLPADCVVVAIGITPNAELGRQAGLATERAILVDAHLTTSDPAIHALGECCQFEGQLYGLVEPIWRQVDVLVDRLCQRPGDAPVAGYREAPTATKLKISGVSLYAFGPIDPDDGHEVLAYHDPEQGEYRRLLLRNGRIEGAVLYGDTAMGPWYFERSLAGTDLGPCRQALLLGAADAQLLLDSPEPQDSPLKEAA
ncbi:NAD(P)/FAD-dependent oxidoreductase [Halomonas heilongjiangensis]|uniref:NAD(P)/FAD-dependent oxidoreductase n=1 Tax=Halomonas heilongjiangensis TaxID=1387883 RepID=A0A2N7TMP7_9GAMM|nr:FAD-dependent oxidoreductase [Halomonas heilongjiangensis]PMR69465.1 NAD(P)/FAD-dependent oxidoreductase [Halomonas heilongjiangensis]PXX89935.1 FAD-dependent oxidoreductase [Halomonas heilongjiangensis]